MKKVFFFCLFFSVLFIAKAQVKKIPADVTDAFTTRYPHATKVEWRDKHHYFEVSFQLNGFDITADFSSNGEWQSSERVLDFNQLPDEVRDGFLKSKYADRQKKDIYELQESGKPLQYRITVQKSAIEKKNLYFDVNGRLLKEAMSL
ncbi:MAG TPA: PepSY-like domain-containing protein [Parafilimonas sp.]|nr:PepSY-like domain-containing protein [Parafilimonas sp.]